MSKTILKTYLPRCLCLSLMLYGSSVMAIPLQALLKNMQDNPATSGSRYDEQRLAAELQQREDNTGWRLFGGVDTGQYRDLEGSGLQKYNGFGGKIGLRYPLLGAMQARRAAMIDSQIALDQARYSTELTHAEQQQQLRQTYIDWWQQNAMAQWCSVYQPLASAEQALVAKRSQEQQLRRSEHLWVEQRWRKLTGVCSNVVQQDTRLRQQLEYFYGSIIPTDAKPITEELPAQLAQLTSWLSMLEQHPALKTQNTETQHLEPLTRTRWTDRIEADFSVSQRYDGRDGISGSGGGTVAAITFEVPLASLSGSSRANSAQARYVAAQHRTEDTRYRLKHVLNQTLLQYQQHLDALKERRLQLEYTQQLVMEQKARLKIDNQEGFLGLRLAQMEQAEIAQALISDWHEAWSVLAQLQVLANEALPTSSTDGLRWDSLQESQKPKEIESSLITETTQPAAPLSAWSTAAYVWDSNALLDQAQQSAQIESLMQAGFNHVYLGFNATQVSTLKTLNPQITRLIRRLKQHGFTVDLLLGDPQWLLEGQRNDLLQLIDMFAAYPFDNLHLDLEVEQLGWPVPKSRLQDWLQTLEAASQRSPWPVTLVSHHRWFAAEQRFSDVCIPCELPKLNMSRVTLMLYSTEQDSVIERVTLILNAWPELQFNLAQSVEPTLPKENSWSGSTLAELKKINTHLRNQLKDSGLAGIAWQDWAQYPR